MIATRLLPRTRVTSCRTYATDSFYKTNLLSSYDKKNVVYIAYVGKYDGKHTYKYGKSTNIYQREQKSHKKAFDQFEMMCVYETNMKDQVEDAFEKELLCREIHTCRVIKHKRQTELFQLDSMEEFPSIQQLLVKTIKHQEDKQIGDVELKKLEYMYKIKMLEYKMMLLAKD